MAATASPLPSIRRDQMGGPADVQRLPSLNELLPDLPTWQPENAQGRSNLYPGPMGPNHALPGRPSIPLAVNPASRHRESFSSLPAPTQLSPQTGHPSPSGLSRSPSSTLPVVNTLEARSQYPPAYYNGRPRDGEHSRSTVQPHTYYQQSGYGQQEGYSPRGTHLTGPPQYVAGAPPSFPSTYDQIESVNGRKNETRRRGNLPKHVTDVLRMWFQDHVAHPYPTEEEKQFLMQQTGLTISQISNWFINARRRSLPRANGQSGLDADLP